MEVNFVMGEIYAFTLFRLSWFGYSASLTLISPLWSIDPQPAYQYLFTQESDVMLDTCLEEVEFFLRIASNVQLICDNI